MSDSPTEVTKRYDPPRMVEEMDVSVRIDVDGPDDDVALALADALYNAVEDAHRACEGGGGVSGGAEIHRCTECGTVHSELPERCDTCGAAADEFFAVLRCPERDD